MAWCPKCGSEYVEGVTVCADCGCPLVEAKAPQEQELLGKAAIDRGQVMEDKEEDMASGDDCFAFDEEEQAPAHTYRPIYINNEEKAEDNRTSAYVLLSVGSIGFLVIVLFFFDIIDLGMSLNSKYMISGVMGVLFILFIIMGIVSMRNSKMFKKKAHKENNLTIEIKKWCFDNLKKSDIDPLLDLEEQPEEIKYFQRFDYVRNTIQRQFINLDEGYLDRLIEEIYSEIFEEG